MIDGQLSVPAAAGVAGHLLACPLCRWLVRQTVETLVATRPGGPAGPAGPACRIVAGGGGDKAE